MQVDPEKHNAYLDAVGRTAPLSEAMAAMGVAARAAGQSGDAADMDGAGAAFTTVRELAGGFRDEVAGAAAPMYLRGADVQFQEALALIVDAAARGMRAAEARDADGLRTAAAEVEVANRDILTAAMRIANWRSGAASP